MGKKILLPQDIAAPGKKWLLERGYELKHGSGITSEIMAREVKGCDGIIARLGEFDAKVLESEPGLRVVARHGAGYDNIDLEAAERLGIYVTCDPVSNANAVAEHVLALIIGCAKKLVYMDAETRRGNFKRRNEILTIETSGKTLGIAGYGRIGRLVAEKARLGLGMKIIVYDPFLTSISEGEAAVKTVDSLETLLEQSDFVSLHMPLRDDTKNIMGEKQFRTMKESAYFINAARGGLADEKALIKAVENRWIAGAALDVFEKEPPKPQNPLMQMEQVILSPHNAALTEEAMNAMAMTAARAVDAVLNGRQPEYCVVKGRN